MPITGQLIVAGLVGAVLAGLILVLSAFKRKPRQPLVPPAQVVVEGSRSPIDPPPSATRSTFGLRVALGIALMVVGGMGLLFVSAMRGLAQLAGH